MTDFDPALRTALAKRQLLRGGLSLGALTFLTGCDVSDNEAVQRALHAISRWNDRVQAALFNPNRLAPEFDDRLAHYPFRYNAWYPEEKSPKLDVSTYRLALGGKIANKTPWTVEELHDLPQVTQITRHVCVEGWSMIGMWSGTPLRTFLERVGADTSRRYVGFECADGYYESLDMPSALHPQTLMAFQLANRPLPPRHGFPFKIRVATKLGFKNPKWITAIYVTDRNPSGFWPDRGYNWFSGS